MKFRVLALVASAFLSLAAVAADQAPWAQGVVKKIAGDKATISHGPIDSVGMGPMTMQFPVRDTAALAKLKAGDKVRFQAIMSGGDIVVTRIEPAK